jgi:hypothetical protein
MKHCMCCGCIMPVRAPALAHFIWHPRSPTCNLPACCNLLAVVSQPPFRLGSDWAKRPLLQRAEYSERPLVSKDDCQPVHASIIPSTPMSHVAIMAPQPLRGAV